MLVLAGCRALSLSIFVALNGVAVTHIVLPRGGGITITLAARTLKNNRHPVYVVVVSCAHQHNTNTQKGKKPKTKTTLCHDPPGNSSRLTVDCIYKMKQHGGRKKKTREDNDLPTNRSEAQHVGGSSALQRGMDTVGTKF
ncbi:hypothetical protein WN55_07657 [Dufourea novaeangliae]|uniref:Uncharacterized protein n=1 Tax=Dufourea novaeangliae TaxID=178035 RepID=A0A154P5P2_DUFNO|nr:hypothetical protein WN55_07657 [Dufourea novaeangliae]